MKVSSSGRKSNCAPTTPLPSLMRNDLVGSIKKSQYTQGIVGWAEPPGLSDLKSLCGDAFPGIVGTEKTGASKVPKGCHPYRTLF